MTSQPATSRDHSSGARSTDWERAVEQVGTPCIDGTTLSASDVERNAQKLTAHHQAIRRAVYAIADRACDAVECRHFLDMIGIDLLDVRAARESRSVT